MDTNAEYDALMKHAGLIEKANERQRTDMIALVRNEAYIGIGRESVVDALRHEASRIAARARSERSDDAAHMLRGIVTGLRTLADHIDDGGEVRIPPVYG